MLCPLVFRFFFFFNDTATTEIYTLSLHDALPISSCPTRSVSSAWARSSARVCTRDRKSTRLNSSHHSISYAVFCLKKKTKQSCQYGYEKPQHQNKDEAERKDRR